MHRKLEKYEKYLDSDTAKLATIFDLRLEKDIIAERDLFRACIRIKEDSQVEKSDIDEIPEESHTSSLLKECLRLANSMKTNGSDEIQRFLNV